MARQLYCCIPGAWFIFLSVTISLLVSSSTARRHHSMDPREIAFAQHMSRVHSFPCSKPQPRSFKSSDVIEEYGDVPVRPSEMILPAMTVLHRCDMGSGCCINMSKHVCSPLRDEMVTLNFKLHDHTTGRQRMEQVKAVNHTVCACMDIPTIPTTKIV